jgi:hypothetical protein
MKAFFQVLSMHINIRSYRNSFKYWEKERKRAMKRHDHCVKIRDVYEDKLYTEQLRLRGVK